VARRILDITRPLGEATPAWPGDAAFTRRWTSAHDSGSAVTCLTFSPHLGTHLDAPLHLAADGVDAAGVPLEACFGPCQVLDVGSEPGPIDRRRLPAGWAPRRPRLLFSSGAWPVGTPLPQAFPGLTADFVSWLAAAGVVVVGVDTPSVDEPTAGDLPAHRRCLQCGVLILEGLDLSATPPGDYTLVALPLRLVGVEASPVRAVLLSDEGGDEHARG
jgi:arylformamidase